MDILIKFLSDELHLSPIKFLPGFIFYEKLLLEWNKKINLISRKSDSIEKHIINSIFFLTKYKLDEVKSIADIGTGGGFPGIPLKILYPEMKVLLVDSIQKKVDVLEDLIDKMKLNNIEAICGRAEEVSQSFEYQHKFDCVISKAVSSIDNLYSWGKEFLNKEGKMLLIKGGDLRQELAELNKLKYNFNVEVINFDYNNAYRIEDKKLIVIKL